MAIQSSDDDLQTVNEDWIKTLSWDLPTNLTGLLWAIGAAGLDPNGQAEKLEHLMTLPCWRAAPAALRSQAEAAVKATPAKRAQLGRNVRRFDRRDWAEWDLEHPYIPEGHGDKAQQLSPIKGGGGVGKSGKELASVDTGTSISQFDEKTQEKSYATLQAVTGYTPEQWNGTGTENGAGAGSQNTIDLFNKADPETVAAGVAWYQEAHDFAAGNGPDAAVNADIKAAGFGNDQAAAITAALSPQQSWSSNMAGTAAIANIFATPADTKITAEQADKLNSYHSGSLGQWQNPDGSKFTGKDPAKNGGVWAASFTFKEGMTVGDIRSNPEQGAVMAVGLYSHVSAGGSGYGNIEKAFQIANGANPDDVLGGAKVRSFYNTIANPNNPHDVVIDSHMCEAMVNGSPKTDAEIAAGAKRMFDMTNPSSNMTKFMGSPSVASGTSVGAYPLMADAVRDATIRINAANGTHYTPAQVQAVVWLQQLKDYPNGANR